MKQELREAASNPREEEYRRAMEQTKNLLDLKITELQVITDRTLSASYRDQLLRHVESAIRDLELTST